MYYTRLPRSFALSQTPNPGTTLTSNPVTFFWIPVVTAYRYHFEIATDAAFTSIVADEILSASNYTTTLADDTYYWRVSSKDQAGNESVSTDMGSFTVDTGVGVAPDTSITSFPPRRVLEADEEPPRVRRNGCEVRRGHGRCRREESRDTGQGS